MSDLPKNPTTADLVNEVVGAVEEVQEAEALLLASIRKVSAMEGKIDSANTIANTANTNSNSALTISQKADTNATEALRVANLATTTSNNAATLAQKAANDAKEALDKASGCGCSDGAAGVSLVGNPQFTVTENASPGMEISFEARAVTSAEGATISHFVLNIPEIAIRSKVFNATNGSATISFTIPANVALGTICNLSITAVDSANHSSRPVEKTISVKSGYVVAPTLTSPANSASIPANRQVTFITSAFAVKSYTSGATATDRHVATQYQILNGTNVVWDSGDVTDASGLLRYSFTPNDTLPKNVALKFQARHKGQQCGWSEWSQARIVTIIAAEALQLQKEFTTPGSQTFTVPEGITTIQVLCCGASSSNYNREGCKGGGLIGAEISVSPGQSIPVTIGKIGGTDGTSAASGGDTKFGDYLTGKGGVYQTHGETAYSNVRRILVNHKDARFLYLNASDAIKGVQATLSIDGEAGQAGDSGGASVTNAGTSGSSGMPNSGMHGGDGGAGGSGGKGPGSGHPISECYGGNGGNGGSGGKGGCSNYTGGNGGAGGNGGDGGLSEYNGYRGDPGIGGYGGAGGGFAFYFGGIGGNGGNGGMCGAGEAHASSGSMVTISNIRSAGGNGGAGGYGGDGGNGGIGNDVRIPSSTSWNTHHGFGGIGTDGGVWIFY